MYLHVCVWEIIARRYYDPYNDVQGIPLCVLYVLSDM